jgi:signal transduction histidine kinase
LLLAFTYALVRSRLRAPEYFVRVTSSPLRTVIIRGGSLPQPVPLPVPPTGAIAVAGRLQQIAGLQRADSLHQLLIVSAVALAIMAVASMGLGWAVAGRALRPLRAMTVAARQLSEHNLHERLPADGPSDELGALATTFNALLARLQAAFDSQRQFVANASHELRTPLTLERAVVEVALADPAADAASLRVMGERILAIGAQQEALIEALLTLARSQRGLAQRARLDLSVIAGATVDSVRSAAVDVRIDADLAPAPIDGDALLVERLAGNLVDNAVRHNQPGGWVRVITGAAGRVATLRVTNSGPVVPADQVERLLQPFQRAGTERTGSEGLGLGLSIVAAVAASHEASLMVTPVPGGGLDVRVTFPASTR